MRRFYLAFEKGDAVRLEFSWTLLVENNKMPLNSFRKNQSLVD